MLVHVNPMENTKSGYWIDSHLGRVEVKPMLVDWGKNRQRWVVYARRRVGVPLTTSSVHITEEQAVVSAQTLANRLYRLSQNKGRIKPFRAKPTPGLTQSEALRFVGWVASLTELSSSENLVGLESKLLQAFKGGLSPSHESVLGMVSNIN